MCEGVYVELLSVCVWCVVWVLYVCVVCAGVCRCVCMYAWMWVSI